MNFGWLTSARWLRRCLRRLQSLERDFPVIDHRNPLHLFRDSELDYRIERRQIGNKDQSDLGD